MRLSLLLFPIFSFIPLALAQSSTSLTTPTPTLSLTTSTFTITRTTRIAGQNTVLTIVNPTTFNVTITPSATTSTTSTSTTASPSPTPSSNPFVLATKVDPAFAVLGVILILTGLPSAFYGHKNRWTSFFLIGFYTLSLVCIVLILKFGVLPAVNPPSKTLRGMFVLASVIAGIGGGAIAIFFWKAARYGIGAWGGFALALWIQCFHDGGLIRSTSFRWILYIGCAVIGFLLCTIPKIHYHILLVSTAFVGSSSFILGVDCFTTAGLKEFYIWNLGFPSLFPKFTHNGIQFPVSQTMQIELGLIAAVALMGIAVQLRVLRILQRKLREITEEQKKRDVEAELQASEKFSAVIRERDEWERDHPTLGKQGRHASGTSTTPLMKDQERSPPPIAERGSSTFTLVNGGRPRYQSGVSDFLAAPTPDEEVRRAARVLQSPGALPTLDLGFAIEDDVPRNFIANDVPSPKELSSADLEELKRKEELLIEIQTIRRSIDALKSETPAPSSSAESRRPSLTSRRTLSIDAGSALLPPLAHLRPPRSVDPRNRVQSMELSNSAVGQSLGRPTSAPLLHEDWDAYVHDRRLLQPPAGVTSPIGAAATSRLPIPQAVTEALQDRKRRESALGLGDAATESSDDAPLARVSHHARRNSVGGNVPVTVLPPRKPSSPIIAPQPQRPIGTRTRTFEELNERHREKMRDMQNPLTQAAKESAELEAAKQRWERSRAKEKEAVTRRQAEKAANLEKRKTEEPERERTGRKSMALNETRGHRHSRSTSADILGSSSKRVSTLKVEDWQRQQKEVELDGRLSGSKDKRESRVLKTDTVPFPEPVRDGGNPPKRRQHTNK